MQGVMSDQYERLSYRELADRLGISPDAARMKAQRSAKNGRWRIIPGNHPSDRVLVEVPTADLNERPKRVSREQVVAVHPERNLVNTPHNTPNTVTERLMADLADARSRIDQLTDLLFSAKDVLVAAQEKLSTAYQETAAARAETATVRGGLLAAKQEVIDVKEAHRRDSMELTAAEMRELGTKAELERALADVEALKEQLRLLMKRQSPSWWKRVFG